MTAKGCPTCGHVPPAPTGSVCTRCGKAALITRRVWDKMSPEVRRAYRLQGFVPAAGGKRCHQNCSSTANQRPFRRCVIETCGSLLVTDKLWRKTPIEVRDLLLEVGVNSAHSRGLCQRCYTTARRLGRVEDFERRQKRRLDVLEDFELVTGQHSDLSMNRRIQIAAPRLDMTESALEIALRRARQERGTINPTAHQEAS